MKKITKAALLALTLSSTSVIAAAGDGQVYAGVKLGSFIVDATGFENATPFGI